jgi:nucleoside-diphosphate-sugar epimerase
MESMMPQLLGITGANGFVGRALCAEAVRRGLAVRGITRRPSLLPTGVENVAVGPIDGETPWQEALQGCDVVIHLAARVHIMRDRSQDPLTEFRRINTLGSAHLAFCAAKAGVQRLINVSSIGVNGASTPEGVSFTERDVPDPHNPYSISKWEAEQSLEIIRQTSNLELVTIRPPLIYGPGVGGNFVRLLWAVHKGIPLPLGLTNNHRDLLYVGNLVDALIICATYPRISGNTYLVSDGAPVSTTELLRGLAQALGVPSRLFPVPLSWLQLAGNITGHTAETQRLLSSLRVNSDSIRRDLQWEPRYTLQQGLQETANWYLTSHRNKTGGVTSA